MPLVSSVLWCRQGTQDHNVVSFDFLLSYFTFELLTMTSWISESYRFLQNCSSSAEATGLSPSTAPYACPCCQCGLVPLVTCSKFYNLGVQLVIQPSSGSIMDGAGILCGNVHRWSTLGFCSQYAF